MDQIKTGKFLAELRRECRLTQEALGEKLNVTNKTISRWENGVYMPDIQMLELLSREFGVSISELIAGQRLPEETPGETADENLAALFKESSFTRQERLRFFKRKWLREHSALLLLWALVLLALLVVPPLLRRPWFMGLFPLAALLVYGHLRNRMMSYVESKIFEE